MDLEVKGKRVVLTFADDINVASLFPEGRYRLTVMKGVITKVDLKQSQQESSPLEGEEEVLQGED